MNVDSFLAHHQLNQNPFAAEEARLDPVFEKLKEQNLTHPDFPKILGHVDKPSTAVVFGEKGTGKTAIRILLAKHLHDHNQSQPENKVLLIPHDDLNPVFDNLLRARKQDASALFESIRLADHQDAILSSAVTKLVDGLLGLDTRAEEPVHLPKDLAQVIKRIPRQTRVDLAALAAVYDQPRSGDVVARLSKLTKRLKLGWRLPLQWVQYAASALGVTFVLLWVGHRYVIGEDTWTWWLTLVMIISGAFSALGYAYWGWRHWSLWRLARAICKETPAVKRTSGELKTMLLQIRPSELSRQPWPVPPSDAQPDTDSRYQLTRRLLDSIAPLGYVGMTVLVDRMDEPTLIAGDAARMKQAVWPMFDAKFLQQNGIGIKLLLPVELRYELRKESSAFFQEARLDKGNLIDRLAWTGSTLYDLCTSRLRACRSAGGEAVSLTDLFEPTVTKAVLVDALDQMHQPRDAFKFLYAAIQEHCRNVTEEDEAFQIDRSTLETVRRTQAERVQDLYRGLSPA